MTFNIKWHKKGVFLKFRGIVNSHDLIDANNYLISNANFETIDYQIFDFSEINDFQITTYDMAIIGSMDKSQAGFNKKIKIAVITNDDYIKELTKEYNKYMSGTDWTSRVFNDIETAKKWINAE